MRVKFEETEMKSWIARFIGGAVLGALTYFFLCRGLVFSHLGRPLLIAISVVVFFLVLFLGKPLYRGIYSLLHRIVFWK